VDRMSGLHEITYRVEAWHGHLIDFAEPSFVEGFLHTALRQPSFAQQLLPACARREQLPPVLSPHRTLHNDVVI